MSTATLEAPPKVLWPTDVLVTAEDLLRHPEWGPCELIRGKVIPVCRPNTEHGVIAAEIGFHLRLFSRPRKLGYVTSNDSGVVIERDPDTLRGPDVHFVRASRWPGRGSLKGYLEIAPDLCVEILSPHDSAKDIETKLAQYRLIGVKRVWVIDPKSQTAQVYRDDGGSSFIPPTGSLLGEDILPGFELPLKELFAALD